MKREYLEEHLQTPYCGAFDVIVCGGGIGGVCAAVAAARHGAEVLLLEKGIELGGLATAGLISWYEPICDGRGNRLMHGMAEELMNLAVKYGFDTLAPEWKESRDLHPDNLAQAEHFKRCGTHFSPAIFAMALDEWLTEHSVHLLLDTQVVRPIMNDCRCEGVVVENKTGRGFYRSSFVIDATGDAQILAQAGVPCILGENDLTYIAYLTDLESCRLAEKSGKIQNYRKWVTIGADAFGKGHPEDFPRLSGSTAEEITQFVMAGRIKFLEYVRQSPPAQRDVSAMPAMAQFRTIRRLDGAYILTEEDCGRAAEDSVAAAGDFAHRGRCYELPLRMLYHPHFANLMAAGRCVSASGWAWDVVRVIPVAAATGQAAGTAAALCVAGQTDIAGISVADLQRQLVQDGVRLKAVR